MSRSERLLSLLETLRLHRHAVSGQTLAHDLGVSLRTVYRDIASLQQQGALIEGSAGVGFVLRAGFTLPPLMFTLEELEAIDLGLHWVIERSQMGLDDAAKRSLAKLASVLPTANQQHFDTSIHVLPPQQIIAASAATLQSLRIALRQEQTVNIVYLDLKGASSQRSVYPIALAYFDHVLVLVAWCTAKHDFRHFRTDRIQQLLVTQVHYQPRRHTLLKQWRAQLSTASKPTTDNN